MAEDADDPTREGLDHLQAAAKEMIAAARSFLDAAEGLVEDPKAAEAVFDTLGSVVRMAARRARFVRPDAGRRHGGGTDSADGDEGGGDDGDDGGVQRIRLS